MPKIASLNDIPALKAYLDRIGAEPRSLRSAVLCERHGNYWRDLAIISVNPYAAKDDDVLKVRGAPGTKLPKESEPTAEERKLIVHDIKNAIFPKSTTPPLNSIPDALRDVAADSIFTFYDEHGDVIMLQHRDESRGEKTYKPWTYFDDGIWRNMEPDGMLPLYNQPALKENTTAFIHEGAKSARAVAKIIADPALCAAHPFGEELKQAAHIGWIGGALSPHRTDFSPLKTDRITTIYLVPDNDAPGTSALPKISRYLRGMTVYMIRWPEKAFVESFDLADPFPERLFYAVAGVKMYNGPTFQELLLPATWATDVWDAEDSKKKIVKLRPEWEMTIKWLMQNERFIFVRQPYQLYNRDQFNSHMALFSDTHDICKLIYKDAIWPRANRLIYKPLAKPDDDLSWDAATGDNNVVNIYRPSRIEARQGAPWERSLWREFMEHLIPDEKEREHVLRWCATLVCRPDIRMVYSLLMISEQQGVGKTTLTDAILTPLVGPHNVSTPSEAQILNGRFNDWAANKRLVVISEIYEGHDWKMYNRLKSYVSDNQINIEIKYMNSYTAENYLAFAACSNSKKAIKIADEDRRWLIPLVTEVQWGEDKFKRFYEWLKTGGLSVIRDELEHFIALNDPVEPGAHAPMTLLKQEMQNESLSEHMQFLRDFLSSDETKQRRLVVPVRAIRDHLSEQCKGNGRMFDGPRDIRKMMRKHGWFDPIVQLSINRVRETLMVSPALYAEWKMLQGDEERHKFLRDHLHANPMVADMNQSFVM